MENYNKLSSNLQQIVLDKLFKEQTNYYNELINQQICKRCNEAIRK